MKQRFNYLKTNKEIEDLARSYGVFEQEALSIKGFEGKGRANAILEMETVKRSEQFASISCLLIGAAKEFCLLQAESSLSYLLLFPGEPRILLIDWLSLEGKGMVSHYCWKGLPAYLALHGLERHSLC